LFRNHASQIPEPGWLNSWIKPLDSKIKLA
jgi:hypothetical protein